MRKDFSSLYRVTTDGCWQWMGRFKVVSDYGAYGGYYGEYAHRVSYEMHVGPIPAGFHIDHLCRNTRCVNPAHLEAVPPAVNILRGEGVCAKNARKTHCSHGHPFDESNTYVFVGKSGNKVRDCRACSRERVRKQTARRAQLRAEARARGEVYRGWGSPKDGR